MKHVTDADEKNKQEEKIHIDDIIKCRWLTYDTCIICAISCLIQTA